MNAFSLLLKSCWVSAYEGVARMWCRVRCAVLSMAVVLGTAAVIAAMCTWCFGCSPLQTGVAIASALDGAAMTLDETERIEGDLAIDSAKTETEARGLLDGIRAKYRPAWVALASALSAALAYAEGSGSLEALSRAYCTLQGVAPKLGLPAVVPCGETP